MNYAATIEIAIKKLPVENQIAFRRDYERRSKSMLIAYLAWFFFGWHYLYMGRVGMQFAFWFTLGFLIVGWLIDFFRIPGMVNRYNEDVAMQLMMQHKAMM